ncbi:MAG: hypothetical protein JWO36_3895 [Myxococcales bacterium]|nr:hypothetical protein [Myxococcales bacterium]
MKYLLLSFSILVAACGDTTSTAATQLNLDRPVDIAFACYGGLRVTGGAAATPDQEVTTTAQPLEACAIRSGAPADSTAPVPVPPGQEDLGGTSTKVGGASYYGFILQSAQGTVAIAQFQTKPSTSFAPGGEVVVLDADPLTPGKNGISVGEDPIAIGTDAVGCYEITANAGSCDMSSLEVNSAVSLTPPAKVDRIAVTNAAGQVIRAKPMAMAMEPAGGTIGNKCPAAPTGLAYVAYPSCHLVAAIDVSNGTIVGGITFDATGAPHILPDGNVTCPDECDGGGAIVPGIRPVTLDIEADPNLGTKLVIGADNSNLLTYADLGPLRGFQNLPLAGSAKTIALQNTTGSLGITNISLSPEIGMGGSMGTIDDPIIGMSAGGEFQFVYAVATDNTVRVADIFAVGKECDTQVDPRFLHDLVGGSAIRRMSCLPVGDVNTPPRRSGARGPGIELIGNAVPTSVDIFRVDPIPNASPAPTPGSLIGYFAIITAADGSSYVVNIDDDANADTTIPSDPIRTNIPLVIAHQLRDGLPDRGAVATLLDANSVVQPLCETNGPDPDATGGNSAGPRATAPPTRSFPSGNIATEKSAELPSIRQLACTSPVDAPTGTAVSELGFSAPVAVRDLEFPDLRGLRSDETWTLTWEGSLSTDSATTAIDGPPVRTGQMAVDAAGMRLTDQTHPFCDAGVEPFDVVQLRGCDPAVGDLDCAIGYRCYVHPASQVTGLGACMLTDEADRLANACKEFLTSIRRYTVGTTTSGELQLLPRKNVLKTTPLDGCTSDAQCASLATLAAKDLSSAQPGSDTTSADTHTWKCAIDPDRKPVPGTGKRCIETCSVDADCVVGRVCQGAIEGSPASGTCMEGVAPPQACINAAQRFELRAAEAFTMVGTKSGYTHPTIADAGGKCVRDPSASPFQIGRIPLIAPACDPTTDPRTGQKPNGTFDANPCSLTVDNTELDPAYIAGTCTAATPATTLVTRQLPAIKFRNRGMNLTLVDPTYPGDATCIGDRAGGLTNVPFVFPGYQLSFRQTAGFSPLRLGISPSFPVKVVRGPQESIWVIDEGDFLSTSINSPSTRGRVFRVEAQSLTVTNVAL